MLRDFIHAMPKAELHLHIEGSLEPELMFELAERNGITLPFASVEEVCAAYEFSDLQSFLDIYYRGAQVLCTEQDFYDLTRAYLQRCKAQNVRHAEIFFDPQTHTERGVAMAELVAHLAAAQVPLTVCPLSNVKLRVFPEMRRHALPQMLAAGLKVTINSDDPAYFGGYVEENYVAVQEAFGLDRATLLTLARNSFEASWLSFEQRAGYLRELAACATAHRLAE